MFFTLKEISAACQAYRRREGIAQSRVAIDTGYSVESVSAFERGRTNNLMIYLWYANRGMDIMEEVRRLRKDHETD